MVKSYDGNLYSNYKGWIDLHLAICAYFKNIAKQRKQIREKINIPFALDTIFSVNSYTYVKILKQNLDGSITNLTVVKKGKSRKGNSCS